VGKGKYLKFVAVFLEEGKVVKMYPDKTTTKDYLYSLSPLQNSTTPSEESSNRDSTRNANNKPRA
jgi:hypothetical protein